MDSSDNRSYTGWAMMKRDRLQEVKADVVENRKED